MNNLIYFVSDRTEIKIPACLIKPSNLSDLTKATLTSNGTTKAPEGFATISKNADNSYKISMFSNDSLFDGKEYSFQLAFEDPSGI